MERQIDEQLQKLKTRLIKMCSLVDEQLEFAIKAFYEADLKLAELVIERDNKVDKYEVKIEKICQKIFALNQPVAMDLRLIMSALTINTNLERVGDIAVHIAENIIALKEKPVFFESTHLPVMFTMAREMLRNSIDAFIENNAKLAQKVIKTDEEMDKLNSENRPICIQIMKESIDNIEPAVTCLVTSRMLERVGDHSTNIAEDVYFIVEAQMIKHKYEKLMFEDDDEADELP